MLNQAPNSKMDQSEESTAREMESDDLDIGPPRLVSMNSSDDLDVPTQYPNDILIENFLKELNDLDFTIQKKMEAIEGLDIHIHIIGFKTYEATHEFKNKIGQMKEERNRLLTSIDNPSELSLILHDLDKKISDYEKELDAKICQFNLEKIGLQEQVEAILSELDDDISLMQTWLKKLKGELDVKKETIMYKAQILAINQKYSPVVAILEDHLRHYEKLQATGWRVEHSEVKLSDMLEKQGLKFTASGHLLTRTGSHLTFQEAQDKGYFKDVSVSLDKIFEFFKEKDLQRMRAFDRAPTQDSFSEGSTIESKMSSEDVKYLKHHVGKPLTLALAEITAKMPKDPIHYLGHYLFKYRYNQEMEEVQKREIDELTRERKLWAKERWQKFVEEEARNAVLDMILRAEQMAYQNELKRIEEEQMMMEGEEEEGEDSELKELLEEARDKFE